MLTPEMKQDYQSKWDGVVSNGRLDGDVHMAVSYIRKNLARYAAVALPFKMPADLVGVIHWREASGNFHSHLANGDPLTARTTHVPPGLPKEGNPPFTWEAAAIAALNYDGAPGIDFSDIAHQLWYLERYNGMGYRNVHHMPSPYLWAGSKWEKQGLYVEDGVFHSDRFDDQAGAALILKALRG